MDRGNGQDRQTGEGRQLGFGNTEAWGSDRGQLARITEKVWPTPAAPCRPGNKGHWVGSKWKLSIWLDEIRNDVWGVFVESRKRREQWKQLRLRHKTRTGTVTATCTLAFLGFQDGQRESISCAKPSLCACSALSPFGQLTRRAGLRTHLAHSQPA